MKEFYIFFTKLFASLIRKDRCKVQIILNLCGNFFEKGIMRQPKTFPPFSFIVYYSFATKSFNTSHWSRFFRILGKTLKKG